MADLSLKPTITGTWLNLKSNIGSGFFTITDEFDNFSISVQVQRTLHTSGLDLRFAFRKKVKHSNEYILKILHLKAITQLIIIKLFHSL